MSDYYLLLHKISTFLWPLSIHEMVPKSLLSLHFSIAPLSISFCPISLLWIAWQVEGRWLLKGGWGEVLFAFSVIDYFWGYLYQKQRF